LSIHPHDLFKNEVCKTEEGRNVLYSQFDNEGIPTHLFNGEEVSKVS